MICPYNLHFKHPALPILTDTNSSFIIHTEHEGLAICLHFHRTIIIKENRTGNLTDSSFAISWIQTRNHIWKISIVQPKWMAHILFVKSFQNLPNTSLMNQIVYNPKHLFAICSHCSHWTFTDLIRKIISWWIKEERSMLISIVFKHQWHRTWNILHIKEEEIKLELDQMSHTEGLEFPNYYWLNEPELQNLPKKESLLAVIDSNDSQINNKYTKYVRVFNEEGIGTFKRLFWK